MVPTLIDILSWIDSADNFENGIGTLDSKERVQYLKRLMTSILLQSSENWNKLDVPSLEKTRETLSKMYNRISYLKEHFSNETEYYENDNYEIQPPHEYEVFPPDGISQALVNEIIKKDKERDQLIIDRIKHNKTNIIRDTLGYVTILDCWQPLVLKSLKQVEGLLDKTYIENVQTNTDNNNPQGRLFLKPVDRNILYSGLNNLLRGLRELDLITSETDIVAFRRLFGYGNKFQKIKWKGPAVALRHFILELERKNKIQKLERGIKYKIVAQLFILKDFPDYDLEKLGWNNGRYKKIKDLKDLVKNI